MRYQITVIGGGTTGVCAAVAAARVGASVLLIEKNGFLGGNAANGLAWLGFHALDGSQMVGGIPMEIINGMQDEGSATEFRRDPICGSCVGVDPSYLKMALHRIAIKSGVSLLFHTVCYSVKRLSDGWELSLCEKKGLKQIETDFLIDCTDTADAAYSAGMPFIFGRGRDGKNQVSSCIIRVGGIDMNAFCGYFKENPDQLRPFRLSDEEKEYLISNMRTAPIFVMGAFEKIIASALRDGVDYPRDKLIGTGNALTGELLLVASRVENVHPEIAENLTEAEITGMAQTKGIMELLHRYLPGCEKAQLIAVGHSIGVRETRHLQGRYYMTAADLMEAKAFKDTIAHGAYHLDIHSPDHKGLETRKPKPYSIPFRICQADGFERLLVAGRTVSADQDAESSLRVIPILGAIGQACGTAAGLAAVSGKTVDEIVDSVLQTRLLSDGCII